MYTILALVALCWVAFGAGVILDTQQTRGYLARVFPPARIKGLALAPLGLGVVLLLGSLAMDRLFWWGFLLGLAALAKGIFLLGTSRARLERLLDWWFVELGERQLRLLGIVALVLGTALFTQLAG